MGSGGGTNTCWVSLCNANLICYVTQLPGGAGGGWYSFFFFYNLPLQIIASIFPKVSVENSSAQ